MTLEARLALGVVLALQVLGGVLQDLDVGIDALGLDRAARRRVVARGGQADGAVLAERDDGLDRTLAEGARADDGRALVVLEGTGDDLGSRGRTAVDQNDHRLALGEVAGAGVVALRLVGVAAAGRDDLAVLEEGVGDRDRLIEQTAGVVAQIEDEALQLVGRDVLEDLVDRIAQAVEGLFVELGDAQITDVAALFTRAHRLDADRVADDLDLQRLGGALAADGQRDRRIDRAAHLVDRLVQAEALHLIAVEMGDEVAGAHAGAGGRGLVDRGDDLDEAVLHGDLDAEATELAARLHLHVLEGLRRHVARMGIERGQHAVDGAFDQLRIVGLLDVVGADALEHVAEQIELAIGLCGGGRNRIAGDEPAHLGDPDHGARPEHDAQDQQRNLAHHPRTFSSRAVAHQGEESIGVPSRLNST